MGILLLKLSGKINSVVLVIMLLVFTVGNFKLLNPRAHAYETIYTTQAVFLNDPGFTVNSLDVDRSWGLVKSNFLESWEKTTGTDNNIVALIDTGVDATHVDLQNIKFVPGFNFITGEEILPGTNSDDNGHGTLIAGILGATPNNKLGIAGTNWRISIMPIKVLDKQGNGTSTYVSKAIIWAADHGARIINLSLGGEGYGHDTQLAEAVTYAFNKNVLLVAAGGNDVVSVNGDLDKQPVFPICNDNGENMVIGVTATDTLDLKSSFSNYGRSCIDVSAPGKRILSTINHDPITGKSAPNSYAYASGTSLAVPFVVGEAALIWTLFPKATNKQIRDRIIASTDNVDNLNLSQCDGPCKGLLGSGRINVYKSLVDPILPNLIENQLVKTPDGKLFFISGAKKQVVSNFVKNQRFSAVNPIEVGFSDIAPFQYGPLLPPLDGTLIKTQNSPTVYFVSRGLRLPVTKQIFDLYKLNSQPVIVLPEEELNAMLLGSFLPPPDGTLIRVKTNKTLFWVVGATLHPISYSYYMSRGLNIFPKLIVSASDLKGFAKGEPFLN